MFSVALLWGGVLKQLLYLIESFALAIKLFFATAIDTSSGFHGYDFPTLLLLSYLLPGFLLSAWR